MKSEKSFAAGCLLALVLIHPAAWQPSHAQPGAPAQAPTPAQTPAPTPAPQTVTGGGQSVAPAQAANVARGENFEVRVSRVVSFSTGEAVVLSVDFDYEFLGRETVHLKGVGVVPSSGSLKFLILEPRLEFREAAGGSLLATVPLAETVVLQGASFDVPKESDLTATAREELWTGGGLFTNRARSVLNASFATGFTATEVGGANVWTTSYARLRNLSNCLIGEVAVSVSHPFNTRDGMLFRVRYAVREARCLSPKWRAPSQEVKTAAETFVTQLIQQMK